MSFNFDYVPPEQRCYRSMNGGAVGIAYQIKVSAISSKPSIKMCHATATEREE